MPLDFFLNQKQRTHVPADHLLNKGLFSITDPVSFCNGVKLPLRSLGMAIKSPLPFSFISSCNLPQVVNQGSPF